MSAAAHNETAEERARRLKEEAILPVAKPSDLATPPNGPAQNTRRASQDTTAPAAVAPATIINIVSATASGSDEPTPPKQSAPRAGPSSAANTPALRRKAAAMRRPALARIEEADAAPTGMPYFPAPTPLRQPDHYGDHSANTMDTSTYRYQAASFKVQTMIRQCFAEIRGSPDYVVSDGDHNTITISSRAHAPTSRLLDRRHTFTVVYQNVIAADVAPLATNVAFASCYNMPAINGRSRHLRRQSCRLQGCGQSR